ncbi:hypothetical protein [Streptomyces sp. NPDC002785]|uniref:hypothetical protein n=1 Tax=Streptomyces sp. NPDC002785 TaxID=3154543 RepID=UPI00332E9E77
MSRPGQVVVLDSTPLPVKVLDDVFGTPVSVHLTIALDAYTHSIVAFRLTPVAESSVEVAMLLRDVLSRSVGVRALTWFSYSRRALCCAGTAGTPWPPSRGRQRVRS